MYKVTVSPEKGLIATYEIDADDRVTAIATVKTVAMHQFGKKYGEVRVVTVEETVPTVTETTAK